MTIDRLGMVKVRHLQTIHSLGSYRNACRVVRQLIPYTNQVYQEKEKVIYLNKKGRDLVGSENEVNGISMLKHYTLRNEVYLHFNQPIDWKNEYTLETTVEPQRNVDIVIQGIKPASKRKVVADACFTRNGYVNIIEIDNTRDMADNRKKVQNYAEILPLVRKNLPGSPLLLFFTTTENRKQKLSTWLSEKGLPHKVMTYAEIN
ncbi:hypothetical protein [Rossellomorea marisflavi]|uniref:hypothetical protein n=1 Tax=Rossellomorea marisflavi TaxID=189381 RepID=UPI00345C81F8